MQATFLNFNFLVRPEPIVYEIPFINSVTDHIGQKGIKDMGRAPHGKGQTLKVVMCQGTSTLEKYCPNRPLLICSIAVVFFFFKS